MSQPDIEQLSFRRIRADLFAIGIIFFYSVLYAITRIFVSPTLELDEAEQFLKSSGFVLGYGDQPPLYSWIVTTASILFGHNLVSLIIVKYSIIFSFCSIFYLIARSEWNAKSAALVTGSLLIFPLYSYEFHRDLSHSVLVAFMASLTLLLYIKIVRHGRTAHYVLAGITIGLGILSKYNFILFATALLLASISFREGRTVLRDRRIFLTLGTSVLILLPSIMWIMQNNFLPVDYTFDALGIVLLKQRPFHETLMRLISSYASIVLFLLLFLLFFGKNLTLNKDRNSLSAKIFRLVALYSFIVPVTYVILFKIHKFQTHWLAPLLFVMPLSLFSLSDLDTKRLSVKAFGYLCILIAVVSLAVRAFAGFMPDLTGKIERIHIPFHEVSSALKHELSQRGIHDFQNFAVISTSEHLAANLMTSMPGAIFLEPEDVKTARVKGEKSFPAAGVIVWEAVSKDTAVPGELASLFPGCIPLRSLSAPYLHSNKLPHYILGAALIHDSSSGREAESDL